MPSFHERSPRYSSAAYVWTDRHAADGPADGAADEAEDDEAHDRGNLHDHRRDRGNGVVGPRRRGWRRALERVRRSSGRRGPRCDHRRLRSDRGHLWPDRIDWWRHGPAAQEVEPGPDRFYPGTVHDRLRGLRGEHPVADRDHPASDFEERILAARQHLVPWRNSEAAVPPPHRAVGPKPFPVSRDSAA